MIIGIGLDIIDIARVENALTKHFIERVFSPDERTRLQEKKMPAETAAGMWAAKEATAKAFGTGFAGGFALSDIEVLSDGGKPYIRLQNGAIACLKRCGGDTVHISITHIKGLAAAQAIIERRS